jgi:hypothetical protein
MVLSLAVVCWRRLDLAGRTGAIAGADRFRFMKPPASRNIKYARDVEVREAPSRPRRVRRQKRFGGTEMADHKMVDFHQRHRRLTF